MIWGFLLFTLSILCDILLFYDYWNIEYYQYYLYYCWHKVSFLSFLESSTTPESILKIANRIDTTLFLIYILYCIYFFFINIIKKKLKQSDFIPNISFFLIPYFFYTLTKILFFHIFFSFFILFYVFFFKVFYSFFYRRYMRLWTFFKYDLICII